MTSKKVSKKTSKKNSKTTSKIRKKPKSSSKSIASSESIASSGVGRNKSVASSSISGNNKSIVSNGVGRNKSPKLSIASGGVSKKPKSRKPIIKFTKNTVFNWGPPGPQYRQKRQRIMFITGEPLYSSENEEAFKSLKEYVDARGSGSNKKIENEKERTKKEIEKENALAEAAVRMAEIELMLKPIVPLPPRSVNNMNMSPNYNSNTESMIHSVVFGRR